jgi:hypothetical protein
MYLAESGLQGYMEKLSPALGLQKRSRIQHFRYLGCGAVLERCLDAHFIDMCAFFQRA